MKREDTVHQIRRVLLLAAGRRDAPDSGGQLELPLGVSPEPGAGPEVGGLEGLGDLLHELALELVWLIQMEDGGLVESPLQEGRRRLRLGSVPGLRLVEEWKRPRHVSPAIDLFSSPHTPFTDGSAELREGPAAALSVDVLGAGRSEFGSPAGPARTREECFHAGLARARDLAARLELSLPEVQELVRRLYSLAVSMRPEEDLPGLIHGHGQRHRLVRMPRAKLGFKLDRERSRGQGIFSTPPEILRELSAGVLGPSLRLAGEMAGATTVVDPACGSGQFLLAAARALVALPGRDRTTRLRRMAGIYGVDLDPLAARTAAHNLSLWAAHFLQGRELPGTRTKTSRSAGASLFIGDQIDELFGPAFPAFLGKNVQMGNALLLEPSSFSPGFAWQRRFPAVFGRDNPGFDVVLGNPPWVSFGLRDRQIPMEEERAYFERHYPAGTQYKLTLYPLFIELALHLVRAGGHHGLLVPDSILSGHHFSRIRARLVESSDLLELALVEAAPWPGAQVGYTVFYAARRHGDHVPRPQTVRNRVLHADRQAARGARKKNVAQAFLPGTSGDGRAARESRYESAEVEVPSDQYRGTNGAPLRIFRDEEEFRFLRAMQSAPFRLKDVAWTYSGLIARHGQRSVQSKRMESRFLLRDKRGREVFRDEDATKNWRDALVSGAEVTPYRTAWDGSRLFVPDDPDELGKIYQSGFDLGRYRRPKVFLRQTGDRLIAAVDRDGLFCLNNLHLVGGKDTTKVSPLLLVGHLMSAPVQRIYRIYALEGARPLAQVDLKTVESLPYPADSEGHALGTGPPVPRTHPQCRQLLRQIARWLKDERFHLLTQCVVQAADAASRPFDASGPLCGREVLTLVFVRLLEMREVAAQPGSEEEPVVSGEQLQDILDALFATLFRLEAGVPA